MPPDYFAANILSQLHCDSGEITQMLASLSDEERWMGETEEGCLALLKKELDRATLGDRAEFATMLFLGLLHHCPENTVELLCRNLNWRTPANREFWKRVIYPALTEAVNSSRLSKDTLNLIRDHCAPLIHPSTRAEMEIVLSEALVNAAWTLYTSTTKPSL